MHYNAKPLTKDEIPECFWPYISFEDQKQIKYGKATIHLCVLVRCPGCGKERYKICGDLRQKIKHKTFTAKCRTCQAHDYFDALRESYLHPSVRPFVDLNSVVIEDPNNRAHATVLVTCSVCGKQWRVILSQYSAARRKKPPRCLSCAQKAKTPRFRENYMHSNTGYILVNIRSLTGRAHELASAMHNPESKARPYILEHRLVMALHLNRPLEKNEVVHHRDGDRAHNNIENLRLYVTSHHPGHGDYYQEWQETLSCVKELEMVLENLG